MLDTEELCDRFNVEVDELEAELQRLGYSYHKDSEGRLWSSLVGKIESTFHSGP